MASDSGRSIGAKSGAGLGGLAGGVAGLAGGLDANEHLIKGLEGTNLLKYVMKNPKLAAALGLSTAAVGGLGALAGGGLGSGLGSIYDDITS